MGVATQRWITVAGMLGCLLVSLGLGSAPGSAIGTEEEEPAAITPSRPPDNRIQAGKQAIAEEEWSKAVTLFRQVTADHPNHADAWNFLAFSYRQLGELEPAFAAYRKALALNPQHRGAHEYIGEAYLLIDDLPKAQFHLRALADICGSTCEEYQELKAAIERYQSPSP